VTKTKGAFPSAEAARKLLFLVTREITRKRTMPPQDWARIRNQLAIRFAGRLPTE
jgi:transposase-like protein